MESKGAKLDEETCQETKDESDFIIKVGEKSFPVNGNVLIAASDYFRAMLSHDTKERQEGVVDMKEVEPDAVKLCIEFIYTGATTVTRETVENLLPAAEIMQLNALSENCVEVLAENLRAENCISLLKLARTHSLTDLEEDALELFRENYNFEEFSDFAKLEKAGIMEHISDLSLRNELAWEVIINWIKFNVEELSKEILEFVKLLDWKSFPSAELLKKLWSEPIFTDSKPCKKFLFRRVFSDSDELKLSLSVNNFFVIRSLSIAYQDITKQARKIIDEFLKINIVQLFKDDASLSLTEDEFFAAFVDHDTSCLCDEEIFWKIAVKWCEHDLTRRPVFLKLMKAIRFDRLCKSFIETSVRNETLLTENPECVKIFIDAVSSQILQSESITYSAVLYPNGKLFAMDLNNKSWRSLPDAPSGSFMRIFSLHDRLCFIADNKLWYFSENEEKWIERAQLTHSPPTNAKIVSIGDFAYIVENHVMSCYDSVANKWDETLPTTELENNLGFCAVGRDTDILVIDGNVKRQDFNIRSKTWSQMENFKQISKFSSGAYHQGATYIVGYQDSYWDVTYVKAHRCNIMKVWEGIKDVPVNIGSSQSWLFSTGENLILFTSNIFYVYHEISNSWEVVSNLPKYSTCQKEGFGELKLLEPISVCAFKGNLSHMRKIDL